MTLPTLDLEQLKKAQRGLTYILGDPLTEDHRKVLKGIERNIIIVLARNQPLKEAVKS